MSINVVSISGNLGRDAELKATRSGKQVLRFSVCVNERKPDDDGNWTDVPNWVDCTLFGNRAEAIARYLTKGTHVEVAGKLSESKWEAQDGTKRRKLEVVVKDIEFRSAERQERPQEPRQAVAQPDVYDDDIPF